MKDQLAISFAMFADKYMCSIKEQPEYNPTAYVDRLVRFWKTEQNRFPHIFPKYIEETEDFYIFEFLEGRQLRPHHFCGSVLEQYIEKQKEVITTLRDWRICNEPGRRWLMCNDGEIRYVNPRQFVHSNRLCVSIQVDDTYHQLSNLYVDGVECMQ